MFLSAIKQIKKPRIIHLKGPPYKPTSESPSMQLFALGLLVKPSLACLTRSTTHNKPKAFNIVKNGLKRTPFGFFCCICITSMGFSDF